MTLTNSWNWLRSNTFCLKCTYFEAVDTFPKSEINLGTRWRFTLHYSVHKCDCWLKIIKHVQRKKFKSGLKFLQMETRCSSAYKHASLRKKLNIGKSIMLHCKILLNKGLSQYVGLFDLDIGYHPWTSWDKAYFCNSLEKTSTLRIFNVSV